MFARGVCGDADNRHCDCIASETHKLQAPSGQVSEECFNQLDKDAKVRLAVP